MVTRGESCIVIWSFGFQPSSFARRASQIAPMRVSSHRFATSGGIFIPRKVAGVCAAFRPHRISLPSGPRTDRRNARHTRRRRDTRHAEDRRLVIEREAAGTVTLNHDQSFVFQRCIALIALGFEHAEETERRGDGGER